MRVFKLRPDLERYRWLAPVNASDEETLLDLHDGPAVKWQPLAVEWIDDELNRGKPISDFPTMGTTPVFSERAVEALHDLLIKEGELLPLGLPDGGNYFVYNTTTTVDALDQDQSDVVRFSSGRILDIKRYELRAANLGSHTIFRLPNYRGRVFVTDQFMDRVMKARLSGFDSPEVWCSH